MSFPTKETKYKHLWLKHIGNPASSAQPNGRRRCERLEGGEMSWEGGEGRWMRICEMFRVQTNWKEFDELSVYSISLLLWVLNCKLRVVPLSSQLTASLHINNGELKRCINKPDWHFPLRIQIPWLDQQDLKDCGLLNLMQRYKPIIQTICDMRIQMDGQGLQIRQLRRENLATSIPTWTARVRKTELQSANQARTMW